jgi:hypothetical protein
MPRNRLLLVVTLVSCVGAAVVICAIASLDKEGNPRLGVDPVVEVLLLFPYILMAAVAVWNRERSVVLSTCLLAVTVVAALAIPIHWRDHEAWRREPPGREVQHMGLAAVLFVQWVGSGVLLALTVVYRLVAAGKQASV